MTEEDNVSGADAPAPSEIAAKPHAYEREEMRLAMRAILMTPLMSPDHDEFGLVRRHAKSLQEFLRRETGWDLRVSPNGARLRKIPADFQDGTRGIPDFDRRRYAIFCLVCAILNGSQAQIMLQHLGEKLTLAASDEALTARGFVLKLTSRSERQDLVTVLRTLLTLGVLQRVDGDEDKYVAEQSTEVLYDINRWLLNEVITAVRGPSTGIRDAISTDERVEWLAKETVFDNEDARRTAMRHHLSRRLLDDPVIYFADLDKETHSYLATQRGLMAARLCDAIEMSAEQRMEGVALVDERCQMTDLKMGGDGTIGHITLLVAEYLSQKHIRARRDTYELAAYSAITDIEDFVRSCIPTHGSHWRKEAREPGAERWLAEEALERLEKLKLVGKDGERVFPLPAIARFALGTPKVSKPARTRAYR
ncbi:MULTISPECIES: TIGR02678 family protein [Cupriavidus]|uniref:TIGR02678 family protein n=4 Tax=Cupriavidus TaxID=106589 RepID=A0A375F657_9BURK|nr:MULTISPECIES: TIGR02678 family protein [Cupriavidus]MCO4865602.1 TIGR02678 family protein [Cupriavidus sp. WGlv3]MCO4893322.1 TIGR02678 family protein [Cupriavidus sp. WGtm5]ULX56039.1 TIGR02678 family protein [Cupriavidus taiwanensis]CAP63722.1 conserved hypothetical protein [Cupriavidus taiwanensis LMG 19424]SOY75416.1 conserved hypothetical protein [Cupriavidus taiwanensis]